MKNALKALALCAVAAASGAALADADQTKLYDPMTAKDKVVPKLAYIYKRIGKKTAQALKILSSKA